MPSLKIAAAGTEKVKGALATPPDGTIPLLVKVSASPRSSVPLLSQSIQPCKKASKPVAFIAVTVMVALLPGISGVANTMPSSSSVTPVLVTSSPVAVAFVVASRSPSTSAPSFNPGMITCTAPTSVIVELKLSPLPVSGRSP